MSDELLINRVGQVEIAAAFVPATMNQDSSVFGLPVQPAQEFGPFVTCPKEDPAVSYGGIFMTAVPVNWGSVSVSILIAAGLEVPTDDIALQCNIFDGSPPLSPIVFEAPFDVPPNGTLEFEILPEGTPIQYSEDMAGCPVSWYRVGDPLEGDLAEESLLVVGFTLRRID